MPAATAKPKSDSTLPATPPPADAPASALQRFIAGRVAAATTLDGPDERLLHLQQPVWDFLCRYYFRLEIDGFERVPDTPSMLVGIHSGGSLTMDAWTLVYAWQRHFGPRRVLHGTAHDVLMAAPGLGDYFKAVGVIPASRRGVGAALAAGHDVIVWPGGEQDAMRSWRMRDKAVLAGRKGHDTVFVLSEGRWLAKATGLGRVLRGATMPIIAGPPFGIALETVPMHVPLPAKIRTEILDPIEVDADRQKAFDQAYVDRVYRQTEAAIQAGMHRLAKRRRFPIFG
jgi:1-acyl-sn-glycerol-3-phosphate acyltransferase